MKNIKNYIFYSGGAKGADTIWVDTLIRYFGCPSIVVYRPEHITQLEALNLEAYNILNKNYLDVVASLKRSPMPVETYAGRLVRRDMLQVLHADSVYAIAPIDKNGYVKGGTGYATTRAIHMGLNVYTFDEVKDSWFKWNYESKKFIKINTIPLLSTKSCCVGSRAITEKGIKEIEKCVNKLYQSII